MPRILDRFPERPRRKATPPKYDWQTLLDGRVYALLPEEYGDPYTFRNSAHAIASRKGFKLRTAVIDGEFILQAEYAGLSE